MIKSMTGYGGAKGSAEGLSVTIELKSVNNRYLDVSVKLPRSLLFAEDALKSAVGRHTSRGKVDMFVTCCGAPPAAGTAAAARPATTPQN